MTTGMVLVRGSSFKRLSTSIPSTLGSFKSNNTNRGGWSHSIPIFRYFRNFAGEANACVLIPDFRYLLPNQACKNL